LDVPEKALSTLNLLFVKRIMTVVVLTNPDWMLYLLKHLTASILHYITEVYRTAFSWVLKLLTEPGAPGLKPNGIRIRHRAWSLTMTIAKRAIKKS
jgi:hypothetical protein